MMIKAQRERDETIEERIEMEIVVDCYDEYEQAAGWYVYLQDTPSYPFQAEVIHKRRTSPLKVGQRVEVIGVGDQDDCSLSEMWVDIDWRGEPLSVPLEQLKPVDADEETTQAVDDWHYWLARGYG